MNDQERDDLDALWRAANFLTVGQIYLQDNPLLRAPLAPEHIKPRLLGHWGTSPGLSFIYLHLSRLARRDGLDIVFLAGPGHGGPAVVATSYLEGTYSEVYPRVSRDEEGLRQLFRQFSSPGGIPSHVGPPIPGSMHEGGELGYVLSHAFGAVFDNPTLIAAAVIGDGEAETAPLAGSLKGVHFLNPTRDGAVLPILHLNGFKIAGPTVLGRSSDADILRLMSGHGYTPIFVAGENPRVVHEDFAAALETAILQIRNNQRAARSEGGVSERPRWPMLVLRTPKGWTGPKVVDGLPVEGTHRAHQVPLTDVRSNGEQLAALEDWLRSYRPETLFDASGRLDARLQRFFPEGDRRLSANPAANAGGLARPLRMPNFRDYAIRVSAPGVERHESTRRLGALVRDLYRDNPTTFRLFCPDETNSNRLGDVFETQQRCLVAPMSPADDHVSPSGRVMEVLSEHDCEGWLEGYLLTVRHGLFATYEAFALIVASMATQHAKWLEMCERLSWRTPIPSLNVLLTSTCWRNDHNGFSHQGPGFMDTVVTKKPSVSRVYLPPDGNCLLAVADRCFRSYNHVNLVIIDKQPQLQWLDIDAAVEHCRRGASRWEWASSNGHDPDVVMACAGDVATLETMAAVDWLRRRVPQLAVRVVNVVDLMCLATRDEHPHGLLQDDFTALFTDEREVVFAFHGYPGALHHLLHGRPHPARFHVHGYREEGTTTTPFDMVVLNRLSRFHLAIDAIRRSRRPVEHADELIALCNQQLGEHSQHVRTAFDDLAAIRDWVWPATSRTPGQDNARQNED